MTPKTALRLAIVGAGSAGLATLYHARRQLPDWQIVCFERGGDVQGAWGHPYDGFVSTSTKFTTQFACHRRFDAVADPDADRERRDFYRDGEFGAYLEDFAHQHDLEQHIELHTEVERIEPIADRWRLTVRRVGEGPQTDDFDALVLCTGLAEQPKRIDCEIEQLFALDPRRPVRGKKIVVVGGGESAVDMAHRLAEPSLGNTVALSVATGIRVSPRYHPIRGVPSDFLRTRLMVSIHEDLRNAIGQKFVEARIWHQELFERLTGRRRGPDTQAASVRERRKAWAAKLTLAAKDALFNVFHNKSDDFLDDVAEGRLRIVGPATDTTYRSFADFDTGEPIALEPDLLVPSIGYRSNLESLSAGKVLPSDFHLACVHVEHPNLFLVGFARPILGNIPSINELQARFVTGLIAGRVHRPSEIAQEHQRDRERLERTYPKLDTDALTPVEMFPYCDGLARRMGTYPTLRRVGSLRRWIRIWLSPASTAHYLDDAYDPDFVDRQPIHLPPLLVVLLLLIKVFLDLPYSWLRGNRHADTG